MVSARAPVTRAARRRLERERDLRDVEPLVRVVELRTPHYTDAPPASALQEADAGSVEWRVRWFVRGHWRRQWHPSLQAHKPLWIAPYIKGPEGLPIKMPSATIFAVKR